MYGCETWTIKKAECRRTNAFELWCWRRLLKVPWTARRSNQSILKEISPGCSLEGMMLKLKSNTLATSWGVDSLEKALMLGGTGAGGEVNDREWDDWMASPTQWTWVWVNSESWWWTGRPGVLRFMGSQRVGQDWATELNWKRKSMCITYINVIYEVLMWFVNISLKIHMQFDQSNLILWESGRDEENNSFAFLFLETFTWFIKHVWLL